MCWKNTSISCPTLACRPSSPTFMPSMSDRMIWREGWGGATQGREGFDRV
jgi:hypothetical protein